MFFAIDFHFFKISKINCLSCLFMSKRLIFPHTTSPGCFSAGYVNYAKNDFPSLNFILI